jgi:N-(2-amino-2-carboxyethyl)-L-glutamate synthase
LWKDQSMKRAVHTKGTSPAEKTDIRSVFPAPEVLRIPGQDQNRGVDHLYDHEADAALTIRSLLDSASSHRLPAKDSLFDQPRLMRAEGDQSRLGNHLAPQASNVRLSGLPRHAFATVQLAPDFELHLKIEALNPGGSIKDKTATAMLEAGIAGGFIGKYTRVTESTSGNLGVAMARQCAQRGLSFHAIVDPNIMPDSIAALKAAGAEIIMVEQTDAQGGYLGTRMDLARQLDRDPRWHWTRQYSSSANWKAHAQSTGPEIADSFERIDHLYIGAGTCGTLTGVGRFMRRDRPDVDIVAVDSIGSVTFGGPPGKRYIPGIGTSRRPANCDPSVVNHLQMVSEADAIVACRWLARQRGMLVGGSTGSVVAAAMRDRVRTQKECPAICVGISPDSGEKYLATIFNDAWVEERFGRDPILRGAASELEISL